MSCGLRDVAAFEQLGIPAVLVASDVFRDGADAQAAALGLPELRRVLLPHPIQNRTDEEVTALADTFAPAVLAALRGHP